MKSNLFFIACLCIISNAAAQPLQPLAQNEDWRRLVLYERDNGSPSGLRSAIHSKEYFLSEHGATDPAAELQATLTGMLAPLSGPGDEHAKCRFPARRIWLQQHLPEQASALAEIDCPAFRAWAKPDQIDSVSLVFANGYLGNPASYYGHTFLKFNHNKSAGVSRLLDSTLNYGAILEQPDDPLSYIVKGMVGGYDGGFSPIEFYFHNATYGENELRDLWEYRLALPEAATRLIIAHAWEVTQKKYTYYFFRRNCAYRVAELIEIASGLNIIPRERPWVIPQALIQKMAITNYAGTPLVSEKIYHPSRQSRLYTRHAALSEPERSLTAAIIEKVATPNGAEIAALPIQRQQAIIDTLLDYYQFKLERGKHDAGSRSSPEYIEALNARFQLPPGDHETYLPPRNAPDSGHAPSYVQTGLSYNEEHGQTIELRIRPAYYDPMDSGSTQAQNSALSMFDTYLAFNRGQLRIRRLDLLAIDSMNTAVTGLPGDKGTGWRFAVGIDEERLACTKCLVTRAQGDIGIGHQLHGTQLVGTMHIGGVVQDRGRIDGWGYTRASLSLVYRPTEYFGLRMLHELRKPFKHQMPSVDYTLGEVRYAFGTDTDLRLRWESDIQHRLTLGLGYYW
jgi:hypothetical protein